MMNLTNRAGLVLSGILFLACGSAPAPEAPASTPAPVTVVSLDTAAREAAARMDTRLPPKTKIALVSVGSSSAQLSEYIISQVEAALVESGKLVVVDRANLDKIRQEQGFQYSGDVSDESAKAIGKLLGAGAIVTGSFSDLGEVYHLALKAINMETAAVAVSYPADVAKSARITAMLASGGGAGTGVYGGTAAKPGAAPAAAPAPVQAVPAQAPVPAPAPAPAAQTVYKIGDTGPAGGIVFYDKGYYADGWRYLEAASSDVGSGIPWSASNTHVDGTDIAIGTGKRNTRLIVESGEMVSAALAASHYNQGGYSDWFLPSRDELDFMYRNLKQKDLGGFSRGWYWSSSEFGTQGNRRNAFGQSFSDGMRNGDYYDRDENKKYIWSVRPVRQF